MFEDVKKILEKTVAFDLIDVYQSPDNEPLKDFCIIDKSTQNEILVINIAKSLSFAPSNFPFHIYTTFNIITYTEMLSNCEKESWNEIAIFFKTLMDIDGKLRAEYKDNKADYKKVWLSLMNTIIESIPNGTNIGVTLK